VAGASSVLSTIDTPSAVKLTDLTSTGLDRALDLLGWLLSRAISARMHLIISAVSDDRSACFSIHVRTPGDTLMIMVASPRCFLDIAAKSRFAGYRRDI
jgi:hypothetical protein